jgi:hypothetical protein
MTANKVSDESKDKAYFTITPQLVWALSKDPYDFTLWNVIKMIAGDSGECYLSTEDLATLAMMSTGKVSQCRKRLIERGLLEGEIRRDPGYPQPVWHLSIPDLWERNLKWRQDIGDDLRKRIELKSTQKESLHVMKASPHEKGITPDEGGVLPSEEGITPDETKEIQKEIQSDNQKGNPASSDFPKNPAPPDPGGADSGKETDDELDKPDRSGPTARGTRGVGDSDLQNSARTPLSTEQQVRDGIFPPDGGEDSGSGEETPCPLLMSFERRTAAAQREAGAWSDAGEDAVDVAGRALARFCDMQGEAPTDDERRATLRELAETLKPLRATIEEIDGAFDVMTEDFGYRVGNYNVFQDSFKRDLATCIRRARGKKQKKPSDRYARTAELAAESQAARRERMAARSPPVSGDFAWEHAKHELQLQMTKATFDVWVKDTYGLPQEDGVYTVVAPNVKARDWLDDRLKTMAQRTLVGILNEQVEVRFEVQP